MPGATDLEPVRPDWKVSQVLRRYPQLLEVLIAASPHFALLRNPVLRQVQPRLVTVAQAAKIGGLEADELVRKLNDALGVDTPTSPRPAAAERRGAQRDNGSPPSVPGQLEAAYDFEHAHVAVGLDVRAYHARREEPFGAIMGAAAEVPVGQVLRLRNTFEPLPLYGVLGKRGFVHQTRQLGPDDWEVLFLNTGERASGEQEAEPQPPASGDSPSEADWEHADATVTIDVSDLVPPEPMVRILEAAQRLQPGQRLLVHHVRRPVYLYPRLEDLGFSHETRELASGSVEILIWKR